MFYSILNIFELNLIEYYSILNRCLFFFFFTEIVKIILTKVKGGESHGQRSLVGYSPWGRRESDPTVRLHFTSLHSLCSVDPTVVRPKAKIVIQAQILEL